MPYPLNHGGAQAFFNMVNEIRKQHKVTLLLNTWNSEDEENINKLQKVWDDVDIRFYDYRKEKRSDTPHEPTFEEQLESVHMDAYNKELCKIMRKCQESLWRKINRRINKAKTRTLQSSEESMKEKVNMGNIARSRSTLYNNFNGLTDGFLEWIYRISRTGFDLIQVEFYEYLPLIHILPKDVTTVFLHHEIRFIHNENELTVFGKVTPQDRLLLEDEKGKEIYNLSKYKHIIVLTKIDKEILQPLLPDANIYVSPAITESAKKLANHMEFKSAHDLVFMGNSDHMPNMDGLVWMCAEVMPLIIKQHPETTLFVTGRWDIQSQHTIKSICNNVVFSGFVDDISSFINGKISVIPIRVGSGMRMKIIDSIASNAPMVTTSKGCEGLPLENGIDAMIVDEPKDFANAVNKLIESVEFQKSIASSAHKKTLSSMNADKLLNLRINFYKSFEKES